MFCKLIYLFIHQPINDKHQPLCNQSPNNKLPTHLVKALLNKSVVSLYRRNDGEIPTEIFNGTSEDDSTDVGASGDYSTDETEFFQAIANITGCDINSYQIKSSLELLKSKELPHGNLAPIPSGEVDCLLKYKGYDDNLKDLREIIFDMNVR